MDWLNLQIIIEIRNLQQLLFSLPLNDCTDQLARLTGRAHEDTLAVFLHNLLGNTWLTMKVLDMSQ